MLSEIQPSVATYHLPLSLHPASWDCTRRQCFLKFNLLLLLTTYRCHLPLTAATTARPSVDCQISYLTPTSTSTSGIFHRGSLHHLTPVGAVAPSSAAPSSLPLFLHKAVVSRTHQTTKTKTPTRALHVLKQAHMARRKFIKPQDRLPTEVVLLLPFSKYLRRLLRYGPVYLGHRRMCK